MLNVVIWLRMESLLLILWALMKLKVETYGVDYVWKERCSLHVIVTI